MKKLKKKHNSFRTALWIVNQWEEKLTQHKKNLKKLPWTKMSLIGDILLVIINLNYKLNKMNDFYLEGAFLCFTAKIQDGNLHKCL